MDIPEILNNTEHRPWNLPQSPWKYYQEWNDVVFLHWKVNENLLRGYVPPNLEIDLFDGKPWVSIVAFTMQRVRLKYLPAFPPISNFYEINIRTYVKFKGKSGVYFLSIEGGTLLSCQIARFISELPYRYSVMKRTQHEYLSYNSTSGDQFNTSYKIEAPIQHKKPLENWLTERYALFQNAKDYINGFDIHHVEWPLQRIDIINLHIQYAEFDKLLEHSPDLSHYSSGVQVICWAKERYR